MLPAEDYARQLDANLDSARNGEEAFRKLHEALNAFPASDEFEPTAEDWQEYEDWLERLEYEEQFQINARFI